MLVLSRKLGERLLIGRDVEVIVLQVHGKRVKLGITGPPEVPVMRKEVHEQMAASEVAPVGWHAQNEVMGVAAENPRPSLRSGTCHPPLTARIPCRSGTAASR